MFGIIAYLSANLNTNDWKLRYAPKGRITAMNKTKLHLTRGTAVLIILFAAAVLAAAVVVRSMPSGVQSGLRSLVDASKAEGRQKYLSGLGWEIEPSSEQSAKDRSARGI